MKRVVSFLLSVVMLVCITSGMDFSVMAESIAEGENLVGEPVLELGETGYDSLSAEEDAVAPQGYDLPGGGSALVYSENAGTFNSARATSVIASGTCGDKLTWSLSSDCELVISGTGKMKLFPDQLLHPGTVMRPQ